MPSSDPTDAAGTPRDAGPRRGKLDRLWHGLVETLAAIGTVLICVLMAIICADIVARNGFGGSLPLVSEAGALLLVMIVALQLAAAVRSDRLARTEMFLVPFARNYPRAEAVLSMLFNLVGGGVLAVIAWATIRILTKDYEAQEYIGVTGIATLPTWPFRAMILLGFAVAAVEFFIRALGAARRAVGGAA